MFAADFVGMGENSSCIFVMSAIHGGQIRRELQGRIHAVCRKHPGYWLTTNL
jgi:hypothetical protein